MGRTTCGTRRTVCAHGFYGFDSRHYRRKPCSSNRSASAYRAHSSNTRSSCVNRSADFRRCTLRRAEIHAHNAPRATFEFSTSRQRKNDNRERAAAGGILEARRRRADFLRGRGGIFLCSRHSLCSTGKAALNSTELDKSLTFSSIICAFCLRLSSHLLFYRLYRTFQHFIPSLISSRTASAFMPVWSVERSGAVPSRNSTAFCTMLEK